MKRIISHILPVIVTFLMLFYAGCSDNENSSPEGLPPEWDDTEEIIPVDMAIVLLSGSIVHLM